MRRARPDSREGGIARATPAHDRWTGPRRCSVAAEALSGAGSVLQLGPMWPVGGGHGWWRWYPCPRLEVRRHCGTYRGGPLPRRVPGAARAPAETGLQWLQTGVEVGSDGVGPPHPHLHGPGHGGERRGRLMMEWWRPRP
ncbi:hypothetical protein NDU88_002382 [Pleurodeles waltl]|uniref:Uncharacterized protein n=1 Tax=Pleurodeles waltl TaxID=8319 RepID=A0AAV7UXF7_PLEWA|nr:hypothetical protein NDU88_002382 [Pleurodeles waltl]